MSKETHYVRDGSGNVLAIYENKEINELVIYGSSRLGSYNAKTDEGKRTLGNKKYELSNHLGNVLAVISDNKIGIGSNGVADYYEPLVISESDYYPFGMAMKERSFSNEEYRFGFNTQEKSTEIGEDTYTAEFWQYDAKIARRWNVDPVVVHGESGYAILKNSPMSLNDVNGKTGVATIDKEAKTVTVHSKLIFYGSEATEERSRHIANGIAYRYNAAKGKVVIEGVEYKVKFHITFETVSEEEAIAMAKTNTSFENNFVRVIDVKRSSSWIDGGNAGFLNINDGIDNENNTTSAHEKGHGYGLIHPSDEPMVDGGRPMSDRRGSGQPDIMIPRNSLVDAKYTVNPKEGDSKIIYENGVPVRHDNAINPDTRKVDEENIANIFNVFFKEGKATIGRNLSNTIFNEDGEPIKN